MKKIFLIILILFILALLVVIISFNKNSVVVINQDECDVSNEEKTNDFVFNPLYISKYYYMNTEVLGNIISLTDGRKCLSDGMNCVISLSYPTIMIHSNAGSVLNERIKELVNLSKEDILSERNNDIPCFDIQIGDKILSRQWYSYYNFYTFENSMFLSIVIERESVAPCATGGREIEEAYTIDLATKNILSKEEILDRFHLSESLVKEKLSLLGKDYANVSLESLNVFVDNQSKLYIDGYFGGLYNNTLRYDNSAQQFVFYR